MADGSEEIETVTIVDVLRRAGAIVELSKVTNITDIASIKSKFDCKLSRGVHLTADSHFGVG